MALSTLLLWFSQTEPYFPTGCVHGEQRKGV